MRGSKGGRKEGGRQITRFLCRINKQLTMLKWKSQGLNTFYNGVGVSVYYKLCCVQLPLDGNRD